LRALRGFLILSATTLRCVRSREDCHPWVRPPFTLHPSDVGCALARTVAAYRLLQTESTYGHTLERPFLTRTRRRGAPRGARSLSCVRARSTLPSFPENAAPCAVSQSDSEEPLRADRSERRTGGVTARDPPHEPAGHRLVANPMPRKFGVSSAAPRVRSSFWERAGLGMSCWPRSSFRRRPAKEDAFPKTEVPSTVRHRAGLGDLSTDLARFELSVTPPTSC